MDVVIQDATLEDAKSMATVQRTSLGAVYESQLPPHLRHLLRDPTDEPGRA